jgi:integrase
MAAKLKLVERAPASVLIPVRGGRKSNKQLGRDRKHRDWLMIHMAVRHGLRASELVGLERARSISTGAGQVARLKGGMPAVHPLDADTMRALRRLYRETGEHDYVFVSERGGPMAREGFQRLVERAGQAAGLGFAVHPHMLRHACDYWLANEGKDAFAIFRGGSATKASA